ncbi:MAG: hypothetical protein WC119_05150 [Synergistaceae bacterium]
MAKIFLSVPILDKPELKMIYSAYQSILSCKEHQVRIYFNENDSLISRVRNVHMSTFLNEFPDCEYFISIDSDLEIINAYTTNNIFTKLIAHDKDFVGGLYALKNSTAKSPICASIPESAGISREKIQFDSGLIEMKWLSSGCWCIKRSVIEKMVNAYPELTYVGDDNVAGKQIHGLCIPEIFELDNNGTKFKKYLSEDWSFCERWRAIGGKIYADTSIVLKHIGKTQYTLWDVEVVSVPKTDPDKSGNNLDKEIKTEPNENKLNKDLPPAGYDLK